MTDIEQVAIEVVVTISNVVRVPVASGTLDLELGVLQIVMDH